MRAAARRGPSGRLGGIALTSVTVHCGRRASARRVLPGGRPKNTRCAHSRPGRGRDRSDGSSTTSARCRARRVPGQLPATGRAARRREAAARRRARGTARSSSARGANGRGGPAAQCGAGQQAVARPRRQVTVLVGAIGLLGRKGSATVRAAAQRCEFADVPGPPPGARRSVCVPLQCGVSSSVAQLQLAPLRTSPENPAGTAASVAVRLRRSAADPCRRSLSAAPGWSRIRGRRATRQPPPLAEAVDLALQPRHSAGECSAARLEKKRSNTGGNWVSMSVSWKRSSYSRFRSARSTTCRPSSSPLRLRARSPARPCRRSAAASAARRAAGTTARPGGSAGRRSGRPGRCAAACRPRAGRTLPLWGRREVLARIRAADRHHDELAPGKDSLVADGGFSRCRFPSIQLARFRVASGACHGFRPGLAYGTRCEPLPVEVEMIPVERPARVPSRA